MKKRSKVVMCARSLLLVLVASALVLGFSALGWFNTPIPAPETEIQSMNSLRTPLTFVENKGQWDDAVRFIARHRGMVAFLQRDALTFKFERRACDNQVRGVAINMAFVGASDGAMLEGEELQSGVHNFFVGNDPSRWCNGVPGYSRVVYRGLYDGVDLCLREEGGWLEYDLLLTEGADLRDVVIQCDGIQGYRIEPSGSLVMDTEYGSITQSPPTAWYESTSGNKMPVACHFRRIDNYQYGFEVPERESGLALVIDPGLEWSTFLGGSAVTGSEDGVMGLALNASGEIVVAGYTASNDFPTISGAYDTTLNGGDDTYVACLSADGSSLLWSTYLGGSENDWPYGVAVDNSGNVTVAGLTASSNFPFTQGAYDTTYSGYNDAFVTRLNADGSQLVYSTFLGGSWGDWAMRLAVDGSGETVVGGYTLSDDFPTTLGAYDTSFNGMRDAFIARLNADGTDLVYSTYLGGNSTEGYANFDYPEALTYMGLALDASGDVFVAGLTQSADFPTTPGAYDITPNGDIDVFVTRLNATGSDLIYSTFLGGADSDGALAIVVDDNGVASVGGYTWGADFPTTLGAYDQSFNSPGFNDAILARLNATGDTLLYSTYIGGMSWEAITDLTLDNTGKVILTGFSYSSNFPTTSGAYDPTHNDSSDCTLMRLSPDGNGTADLLYSSFVGGASFDEGTRVVLVADSTVIVGGVTFSDNFPTTPGAYDPTINGSWDGHVFRFGVYIGIQEAITDYPKPLITLSPVFPNPGRGALSYSINLLSTTKVKVSIFDITGRLVETLLDKELPAGTNTFTWNARRSENLASGIYYLQLDADAKQQTRKFVILQ